jgi:F0F1-type ATP synthase assembly protein I
MLVFKERARFAGYGLITGLLVGIVLGWMFHGVVGTILWMMLIAVIVTPFVLAVIFWQKTQNRNYEERSLVRDAEWRDTPGERPPQ